MELFMRFLYSSLNGNPNFTFSKLITEKMKKIK